MGQLVIKARTGLGWNAWALFVVIGRVRWVRNPEYVGIVRTNGRKDSMVVRFHKGYIIALSLAIVREGRTCQVSKIAQNACNVRRETKTAEADLSLVFYIWIR